MKIPMKRFRIRPAARMSGFTLIETLIALSLVGAVLLPSSVWLYQSRNSRSAWERFRAVQGLEMRMNRALLLRQEKDSKEEVAGPRYLRYEIRLLKDGEETRLLGLALDRKGGIVARLQGGYFEAKP